ncbi:MAG: hypothetical protein KC561_09280, partial [Myxococcales bacterium]|nr:hypothetical protein [Myxococcales bacterium]
MAPFLDATSTFSAVLVDGLGNMSEFSLAATAGSGSTFEISNIRPVSGATDLIQVVGSAPPGEDVYVCIADPSADIAGLGFDECANLPDPSYTGSGPSATANGAGHWDVMVDISASSEFEFRVIAELSSAPGSYTDEEVVHWVSTVLDLPGTPETTNGCDQSRSTDTCTYREAYGDASDGDWIVFDGGLFDFGNPASITLDQDMPDIAKNDLIFAAAGTYIQTGTDIIGEFLHGVHFNGANTYGGFEISGSNNSIDSFDLEYIAGDAITITGADNRLGDGCFRNVEIDHPTGRGIVVTGTGAADTVLDSVDVWSAGDIGVVIENGASNVVLGSSSSCLTFLVSESDATGLHLDGTGGSLGNITMGFAGFEKLGTVSGTAVLLEDVSGFSPTLALFIDNPFNAVEIARVGTGAANSNNLASAIFLNTGDLPIDLGGDGSDIPGNGDDDSTNPGEPNDYVDVPVIDSVDTTSTPGSLVISGTASCVNDPCNVVVFAGDLGDASASGFGG